MYGDYGENIFSGLPAAGHLPNQTLFIYTSGMNHRFTKPAIALLIAAISIAAYSLHRSGFSRTPSHSDTEAEFEFPEPDQLLSIFDQKRQELKDWKRPEGPLKVALQAGHWKAGEAPEELQRLRERTGTSGGGKAEWQVNLKIAEETKKLLEKQGITVDLLPATVPPGYWADVFVAIHADGNENSAVAGFKAAAPRRDLSGKAPLLTQLMETEYQTATKLARDPNVTRNMTGYYAFNWRRYQHSLHPMTAATIIETGFLTNSSDRKVILQAPQKAALGIANGILKYFEQAGIQTENL